MHKIFVFVLLLALPIVSTGQSEREQKIRKVEESRTNNRPINSPNNSNFNQGYQSGYQNGYINEYKILPNPIKYNTSTESNALKLGDFWIGTGDVSKGPTSITGYWNGITPPAGGYTVYLNKASKGPSISLCSNDADLIALTNRMSGNNYTTVSECLSYFSGQPDKVCFNRDYEGIVTDGLVLNLDAGFTPSYPKSGNTWYDISGNGNNTSIGVANFSNGVFESITSPSYADRLEFFTPNSTSLNNALSVTTGGWTIQEWVRIDDATYPEAIAGTVASGRAYRDTETGFDWNHGEMSMSRFEMGASSALINDNNTYDAIGAITIPSPYTTFGVWYCRHLYWDRDNNQMGLYYNDAHMGSISMGVLDGYSVYDGGGISWGHLYGWRHEGARASIKIWNRVLSSAEVSQNYNAQKDRFEI